MSRYNAELMSVCHAQKLSCFDLAAALPAECTEGYSSSRTCEIGLAAHAGIPYRSIVHLVDGCAEPLAPGSPAEP